MTVYVVVNGIPAGLTRVVPSAPPMPAAMTGIIPSAPSPPPYVSLYPSLTEEKDSPQEQEVSIIDRLLNLDDKSMTPEQKKILLAAKNQPVDKIKESPFYDKALLIKARTYHLCANYAEASRLYGVILSNEKTSDEVYKYVIESIKNFEPKYKKPIIDAVTNSLAQKSFFGSLLGSRGPSKEHQQRAQAFLKAEQKELNDDDFIEDTTTTTKTWKLLNPEEERIERFTEQVSTLQFSEKSLKEVRIQIALQNLKSVRDPHSISVTDPNTRFLKACVCHLRGYYEKAYYNYIQTLLHPKSSESLRRLTIEHLHELYKAEKNPIQWVLVKHYPGTKEDPSPLEPYLDNGDLRYVYIDYNKEKYGETDLLLKMKSKPNAHMIEELTTAFIDEAAALDRIIQVMNGEDQSHLSELQKALQEKNYLKAADTARFIRPVEGHSLSPQLERIKTSLTEFAAIYNGDFDRKGGVLVEQALKFKGMRDLNQFTLTRISDPNLRRGLTHSFLVFDYRKAGERISAIYAALKPGESEKLNDVKIVVELFDSVGARDFVSWAIRENINSRLPKDTFKTVNYIKH